MCAGALFVLCAVFLPGKERASVFGAYGSPFGGSFSVQEARPWEIELRRLSFRALKDLRRWSVRGSRYIRRTFRRWVAWSFVGASLLLGAGVATTLDLRLFRLWRERGTGAALLYLVVGTIVFGRLLLDRRLPLFWRTPVVLALVYGLYRPDFLNDAIAFLGWGDDFLVCALAARWYVRTCPQPVVEEHAIRVGARPLRRALALKAS
ncbi:MAG: hypothetical protein KatS3mg076_0147 [Candidatus Binatia bacterium]|nr:MAG: hypothetical protein KatS3mg076_0147 [Candidatus Binatia bacterium]